MYTNRYLLLSFFVAILIAANQGYAQNDPLHHAPPPNPPRLELILPEELKEVQPEPMAKEVLTEWMYHKTADGEHPNGTEQQMVWLMNRARSNPAQEGIWLATMDDPDVVNARNYFGVDVVVLQNEFASYSAKPPAAFDVRLYEAARLHSEDLIARDAQDHIGQFTRIDDAGFSYLNARGNVFSYTRTALYGHAGFNIDWGDDGGDGSGMQPGRGHRQAIMSLDGNYTNIGIAAVPDNDPQTSVGPLVVTGNFCFANIYAADHHNRFIVGTVWDDTNENGQYDPGEGVEGVTVTSEPGAFFAISSSGGGYAVPAMEEAAYQVTFSGGLLPYPIAKTVTVSAESVLLDFIIEVDAAPIKGDVNRDGSVDLEDVIAALRVASGVPVAGTLQTAADVNGDYRIGIAEALYGLQMLAGGN